MDTQTAPTPAQRREQALDRTYADRVAFIAACHLPTAYLKHVLGQNQDRPATRP